MNQEELYQELETRLDEALIVEEPSRHAGYHAVYRDRAGHVVVEEQDGPRFTILIVEDTSR